MADLQNATPATPSVSVESEEALPCPFCGSPAKLIHPMGEWMGSGKGHGPNGSRYVCSALYENPARDCEGRDVSYGSDQDAEALAAWNTRAALTEPAPAGAAVEPVGYVSKWALPLGELPAELRRTKWRDGDVPVFTHPAPEDTARLREDLERLERRLSAAYEAKYRCNEDANAERRDRLAAERERDDARKALETATEEAAQDEADRILSTLMNVREGSWASHAIQWLRMDGAMLPANRAAAHSASREATR